MEEKRLVRRRGGFSDRNNINPISKEMQFSDFDEKTRIKLKNLSFKIVDLYKEQFGYSEGKEIVSALFADGLFCISTRASEFEYETIEELINKVFDEGEYDEILDTIEFISSNIKIKQRNNGYYSNGYGKKMYYDLQEVYNELFEEEYIGYRFINNYITRITNKGEIESICEASSSDYDNVSQHIDKAICFLSESENKDYKNSIKESITAVEALCSIITNDEKATLGSAINKISKEKNIHPAFKDAINKLYGFASDEPGIRHGSN
ncbi:MAG: hypothetical protein MSH40_01880 [Christensenella sp.]|nr:hypothetical protein [Christensenella sp.]